jgi:hypothetical protein
MAKYDRDGTSAAHRAERSATDKLLNDGDRAEFRKSCDETSRKMPSDSDNDGK